MVFFKTTRSRARILKEEIMRLHPYDLPEILELKLDDISTDYLSWLEQVTMVKADAKVQR
jgi:periplasmic divalent cation tolerance protein